MVVSRRNFAFLRINAGVTVRHMALMGLCLAGVTGGCSDNGYPADPPTRPSAGVAIQDNQFSPGEVTIKAGEDVTWVWEGADRHGLRFLGSPTAAVEPTGNGHLYVRSFETPGVYMYYCPRHGEETPLGVSGMSGRVTVQK